MENAPSTHPVIPKKSVRLNLMMTRATRERLTALKGLLKVPTDADVIGLALAVYAQLTEEHAKGGTVFVRHGVATDLPVILRPRDASV